MNSYVLTGMPSSGKTTKGKRIARMLNMRFIDTDKIIENRTGMKPSEIVAQKGRDEFLRIQNVIVSALQFDNAVIATGGGIIYCPEAMDNLKKKAEVIFLNVPLHDILSRIDRKRRLSGGGKDIKEIYEERQPMYREFADFEIICDDKEAREVIFEIVNKIKRRNKA